MPQSQYIDLRLPNGRHSGLRLDPQRMVLELQREGIKYYFDLAMMYNAMYNTEQRIVKAEGLAAEYR